MEEELEEEDEEQLLEVWLLQEEEELLAEGQDPASKFIDQLVKARRESRGSHKLRMTIICEDFGDRALFTQAQADDRGVVRLVFDDIPNFGMIFLPPRYIADVRVRELRLWSNVPEPQVDVGEEDDSDSEEDSDSKENSYSDDEDSDFDDESEYF
ncbi:hypothetical protein AAVH_18399 [Aphelenchoides avenae]|nr:hypothetical protein AAVH_18399 [Aphelenchus avenae]